MGIDDEHLCGHVLLPAAHAGNSTASPALGPVGIHFLAFHVAEIGQGQHAFLLRNQILDIHLAADCHDLRFSLVSVLIPDSHQLILNDGLHPFLMGQDILIILDLQFQRRQFVFDFLPFQAGELSQAHLHNGLGLHVVQAEPFRHSGLGGGTVLGIADNGNNLVDIVQRDLQAL